MEFTCTQENLLQGLTQVVPITGRNTQLPVLHNVLLEVRGGVLHMTGTDLEVGVHAIVGGKVGATGGCVVPARQLFEYVQQLPSDHPIEIKQKGKAVAVTTPGFQASLRVTEVEDFPLLPAVDEGQGTRLTAAAFCRAVSGVLFAAAREESRPEIHSIFMVREGSELRLAATDSFRLAEQVMTLDSSEGKFSLLLPLATAQEVVRLFATQASLELVSRESLILFRGEGVELSSRLLDATYPDYRQIIPHEATTRLTVEREEFTRALKTLLVFLPRDSRRIHVRAHPTKRTLHLSVAGGEVGEGEVTLAVEGEGEAQDLLLNVQYLLEGAQHMPTEQCEIAFKGAEAPVVFRPAGRRDYVYVVMPIQA